MENLLEEEVMEESRKEQAVKVIEMLQTSPTFLDRTPTGIEATGKIVAIFPHVLPGYDWKEAFLIPEELMR